MEITIHELFETLANTSSSNDRKLLIKQALESDKRDLIMQIFEDCYGPAKYNITSDRILNDIQPYSIAAMAKERTTREHLGCKMELTIDEDYEIFHNMLNNLAARMTTGYAAVEYATSVLMRYQTKDLKILRSIIDKNLKVGFSLEQLNKLQGKKKKGFEVSLAFNLDDVKGVDPVDGTYFASRKLDGCRCTCFVETAWTENGKDIKVVSEPVFKSRQGKEFTTLDKLKEPMHWLALNYHLVGKLVFDGEVCILDENGNEHFDWIMKEIRRKDHTIENPCYNIFDVVTQEEFDGEVESPNFTERDFSLTTAFSKYYTGVGMNDNPKRIRLLKQELIQSQDDFDRWSQYVSDGGWEGFMLRKDAPYKSGRTKDLLKVKKFKDAEYKVIGYETGTMKYGTEEITGVARLHILHKGNVVSVGSGLTKEQRIAWKDNPDAIVGKTITVQYFEETQDKKTGYYSLRFPVLKYVYEGERDV